MKTLQLLLRTGNDLAPAIARITLGLVMFPHGAQKTFGWFGGSGFTGTMGFFTQQVHIPTLFAFLAIAAEFAGALGLIFGTFSRVAAFGIAMNMFVAIVTVHWANGFFVNWTGAQHGEGFEYHLLVIGLALIVMFQGAGRWSLDRLVSARLSGHSVRTESSAKANQTGLGITEAQVQGFSGMLAKQIPLGRVGAPDEIAKAVVFLASDDSSYISGFELVVDCGLTQV